jgi:spermidine synthase
MAANLIGAIIGALTAGFVLVPLFGLWQSLSLIALAYAVCALVVTRMGEHRSCQQLTAWLVFTIIAVGSFTVPSSLGALQRLTDGETLLFHKEGSSAAVAVVKRRNGHLKLKINNTYGLGGTLGEIQARRMGHLPLLLHENPRRIAFIGVATGITMSALNLTPRGKQVESALAIELLPHVVEAANVFREYTGDVLSDTRLEVRIGDGRHILNTSDEHFDVITLDLVTPWHASAGSLYTVEFYTEMRDRLADRGIFCQWLPLYQLGPREFEIIASTFQSVFPHVQLWRGSHNPRYPMLGLFGSNHEIDLERDFLAETVSEGEEYSNDPYLVDLPSLFLLYAGNEDALRPLVKDVPLNSDDRPLVEYLAPLSHLSSHQLLGEALIQFFDDMLQGPGWTSASRRASSTAGNLLLEAKWEKRQKDYDKRTELLVRAKILVPESQYLQRFIIGL